MRLVRLHPEAQVEFDAAADLYEARSAGLGETFIVEVDAIIARISEAPLQFPRWRDRLPYRKAILPETFPFVVFFREQDDHIRILAVAHGARKPGYWRHRR